MAIVTQSLRACLCLLVTIVACGIARAQDAPEPADEPQSAAPAAAASPAQPTVWDLTIKGGLFMIPIFGCSVIVVAFTIERMIGLRRGRIIPHGLLTGLEEQTSQSSGLDPRVAVRLCEQFPSPMANVLRAGLLKIGRPHAEVEKAVEDSGVREVGAMFRNVRPLNACASVGPLLGLLGTVQGMIVAFIVTSTTTATGTAKAQELAQGIYTALVTTFAGLCVAIPAVLFAHYFEGWIERLVREIEEIMVDILPHLERFEGKTRLEPSLRRALDAAAADAQPAAAAAAVVRASKHETAAVPATRSST